MMRLLLSFLALFAFAQAAQAEPAATDPLAPARAGMVQCYAPVAATKGCRAIGSYRFQADGAIVSESVTMLNAAPLVVLHMSAPNTVRGNLVCGQFQPSDLDAATFEIDGAPASQEQTQHLRDVLKPAFAPLTGEICSSLTPQGDSFVVNGQLNGQAVPAMTDTMIWVRPEDGYAVRAP